jgi:mannose-6-phosphate isomerase-like protein (cupin superfamily)
MSAVPMMRDKVFALEAEVKKLPQAALETRHYFADGMYARELYRPAGTLIVGKVHRKEHFYIVTKGRVKVTTEEGVKELASPSVLVSRPGTKRAVYALEDSVCMTVHRTKKKNLDKIERELIEEDKTALFDARNELKPKELPCPG